MYSRSSFVILIIIMSGVLSVLGFMSALAIGPPVVSQEPSETPLPVTGSDLVIGIQQDGSISITSCSIEDCGAVARPPITPTITFPLPPWGPFHIAGSQENLANLDEGISISQQDNTLIISGIKDVKCYTDAPIDTNAPIIQIRAQWSGEPPDCSFLQNDESILDEFLKTDAQNTIILSNGVFNLPTSTNPNTHSSLDGSHVANMLLRSSSGELVVCRDCAPNPQPSPECYFGCCDWPLQPLCSVGVAFLSVWIMSPENTTDDAARDFVSQALKDMQQAIMGGTN